MTGRRIGKEIQIETLYEDTLPTLACLRMNRSNKAILAKAKARLERLELVLRRGDILRVEQDALERLNQMVMLPRREKPSLLSLVGLAVLELAKTVDRNSGVPR